MLFIDALKLMKQGEKVKLPSWGGYWYWDDREQTVMMHTKDGKELDIRVTTVVEYTLLNICSDEWVIQQKSVTLKSLSAIHKRGGHELCLVF